MRLFDLLKNEKGSMLALAIILVVLLTFSGLAFLHAGLLEKRMGMEERWNQKAFYLAQAGIERARVAFNGEALASWTPVLDGSKSASGFSPDPSTVPDPLLCPSGKTKGCVILPFQTANGQAVSAPGMPFSGTGDPGFYSVRAFNNGSTKDSGTTDGDGIVAVRALGNVNGEVKVIEANVKTATSLGLMDCLDTSHNPPQFLDGCYSDQGNPSYTPSVGRNPTAFSTLPTLDLSSPSKNYYGNPSTNFQTLTQVAVSGTSLPSNQLLSGRYYSKTGNLTVNGPNTGTGMLVIYATGNVTVNGTLTNAIVIGANSVTLNGTIQSPSASTSPLTSLNFPAVVAGTGGVSAAKFSTIQGNVLCPTGTISLDRVTVHGSLIGKTIHLKGGQGNTSTVDDQPPTVNYYDVMPGVSYPPEVKNSSVVTQTWKEIQ